MKKLISLLVSLVIIIISVQAFSSCSKEEEKPDEQCTVTFDYNYDICFMNGQPSKGTYGNQAKKDSRTVSKGEYLSSPPVLASRKIISLNAPLYFFGGWYKEPACENSFDFNSEPINTDITLYAKWIKIPAEIVMGD